jgi:hypothetical protein
MLDNHATWDTGGVSVESGVYQIRERMSKGTFKIFAGQPDLMQEYRQYHRDEKGKIVKVNDDILSAVRYAYMMQRFAIRAGDVGKQKEIEPLRFKKPWG